jgi:Family of unknown function (DUF6527)
MPSKIRTRDANDHINSQQLRQSSRILGFSSNFPQACTEDTFRVPFMGLKGVRSSSGATTLVEAYGGAVYIDSSVNHTGTIEANNGDLYIRTALALSSTTEAINGGRMFLYSATLSGGAGTLTSASGGQIYTNDRGSVFDGTGAAVNISNPSGYGVEVQNSTALTLRGTLNNAGRIQLIPGVGNTIGDIPPSLQGNPTDFYIDGNVTLQGGGELQLTGNGLGIVTGTCAAATLTNVDNLIDGVGQLDNGELTLINQTKGTIAGSATLILNTGSNNIENYGMIGASVETLSTVDNFGVMTSYVSGYGGGNLLLEATVNNSGTIEAYGGAVYIDSSVNNTGTIEATAGHLYVTGDVGNSGGMITIDGSGVMTLRGGMLSGGSITDNGLFDVTGSGTINGDCGTQCAYRGARRHPMETAIRRVSRRDERLLRRLCDRYRRDRPRTLPMTRAKEVSPEFVEYIPERLEPCVLYISRRYSAAAHLCCCGCGHEVVTPLNPAKWHLKEHNGAVSLSQSVGNWSLLCKSHYWIRDNCVRWAGAMSPDAIAAVQARDLDDARRLSPKRSTLRRLVAGVRALAEKVARFWRP